MSLALETKRTLAADWFRTLRDRICAAFERIEADMGSDARFQRTPWDREGGGGGEMSLMKGKVFEKVGVNISTVYGEFSEAFRKEIPGAQEMPCFWASGISLVAHMCSPRVPAVHMNTRMIVLSAPETNIETQDESTGPSNVPHKLWFGGGGDLNPMVEVPEDTAEFHAAFKAACDRFDPAYYPKFKAWCDEYFFIKHRNEPRGVGGIFYDYINSGNWENDFAFTQAVGEAFLDVYPRLVRRHMHETWTAEERRHQLKKRGRYAEFNLIYDRGTRFGLMTGGNTNAILMSLPPEAVWE